MVMMDLVYFNGELGDLGVWFGGFTCEMLYIVFKVVDAGAEVVDGVGLGGGVGGQLGGMFLGIF